MVDILRTKCGSCKLLQVDEKDGFSCPRNKHIPKNVEPSWAIHCNLYERGVPQTVDVAVEKRERTVFFTRWFAVNVNRDYKTVKVVARDGYELKVTPESTCEKILVVALEKEA